MIYDIIFVTGELFFDHPLSGIAILKRLLEKNGYKVGIIEMPQKEDDIKKFGNLIGGNEEGTNFNDFIQGVPVTVMRGERKILPGGRLIKDDDELPNLLEMCELIVERLKRCPSEGGVKSKYSI